MCEFLRSLDFRANVGITEFQKINWLPVNCKFRQCFAANAFKFFDNRCSLYMADVFDKSYTSQGPIRNSTKKLSQPLTRTTYGQNSISFLVSSVWNNLTK